MSIIDSLKKLLDDGTQKRIATEDPGITGYRRIKGPAGSGKSLTLIARAVKLAIEGKQVIVSRIMLHFLTTSNTSLWNTRLRSSSTNSFY